MARFHVLEILLVLGGEAPEAAIVREAVKQGVYHRLWARANVCHDLRALERQRVVVAFRTKGVRGVRWSFRSGAVLS